MKHKQIRPGRRMCAMAAGMAMAVFIRLLAVTAFAAGNEPAASGKTGNMAVLYGMTAVFAALILLFYVFLEKQRERKFILLYSAIFLTDFGYFLLSVAKTLNGALIANGIAYLGAAYAVLIMLLIILDACKITCSPFARSVLILITTAVFLIAASGPTAGLYYKSVSFVTMNGATVLLKDYGPLHILYPIYLLGYLFCMIGAIAYSVAKKKIPSAQYAALLFVAVLGNAGIWLIEQLIQTDFEFLSVSYIISALLLLFLCRMRGLFELTKTETPAVPTAETPENMERFFEAFFEKVRTLTPAEQRILRYYIDGHEISEIPELACISIHTVKKHNHNIYQKLEISSRDELLLHIDLLRRCGKLGTLIGQHNG